MRNWAIRGGLAAAILFASVASYGVMAQTSPMTYVVGIWTHPNQILPFAEFRAGRWRQIWRTPAEMPLRPVPLGKIPARWWGASPVSSTWELVEPNGGRRLVQIAGTGTADMGSSCAVNVGLTIDVTTTSGYPSGLASSRPGMIDPVRKLTSPSADWRAVAATLPVIYRQYEADAWSDIPDAVLPDLQTAGSRPKLAAAFGFTDDVGQFTYFESERVIQGPFNPYEELSFITGWLWQRSPGAPFQVADIVAVRKDADNKGAHSFQPLGVARDVARRYWLGSLSGYAYGGMAVVEVARSRARRLLTVDYPGC